MKPNNKIIVKNPFQIWQNSQNKLIRRHPITEEYRINYRHRALIAILPTTKAATSEHYTKIGSSFQTLHLSTLREGLAAFRSSQVFAGALSGGPAANVEGAR